MNWFWRLLCPWHHHNVVIDRGYVVCAHCGLIIEKLPEPEGEDWS